MKYCYLSVIALVILVPASLRSSLPTNEGASSTSDTSKAVSEPTQRVHVSQGVMSSLLISHVNPQYPAVARITHVQGRVVLKAFIDKEGNVRHLKLVSGPEMLGPAAIEAVKTWKYKPYLLNGKPVDVETEVVVDFALSPPKLP